MEVVVADKRDWWGENAPGRDRGHTLVDLGYVNSQDARDRCDTLRDFGIGRQNVQIGGFNRLLIRIPPTKVSKVMAAFPAIEPNEDGDPVYCWTTHHWLDSKK